MQTSSRSALIRLSTFGLIAFAVGLPVARANVLPLVPTLPPPTGIFALAPTCIAPACFANISVSGFQNTSDTVSGGNEMVSANAVFTANVFQNIGGSPGALVGSLSAPGTIDFTFFGRTSATPTGTFNAQITDFDFMGTFNTHTFEAMQNPNIPTTGQTTIDAFSGGTSKITSFFDIFSDLRIDNGPFIPGPGRPTTLTTAPEPGSLGLAVFGLLGFLVLVSRRWRPVR